MTTKTTPPSTLAVPRIGSKIADMAQQATPPDHLADCFEEGEWEGMTPVQRETALDLLHDEASITTQGIEITFPRVKYPSSGSNFWTVPTADGEPEPAKTIEGVVVFKQTVRAYWPIDQPIGKNPPKCSSLDGIRPIDGPDRQATNCRTCPHAQWGTGKEGRGQACKQRLNVFLIRDNEPLPTLVSLPPTALRPFSDYAVQLRQAHQSLLGVVTVLGLVKAQNAGGTEYQGVALKIGRKVRYTEMQYLAKVRALFEDQMAKRGVALDDEDEAAPATAAGDPPPPATELLDQEGKPVA